MAKKSPTKTEYFRLVVPVSKTEFEAVTRVATSAGFKNAHRWAAVKINPDIREAVASR